MVIADCFLFCFQGNRLFKEGKYELAKAKYEKVWSPWYCLVFNVLQSYPSYNWNLFDCVAAYFDKLWCLGYWWTLNDLLHLYIKCSPQKVMLYLLSWLFSFDHSIYMHLYYCVFGLFTENHPYSGSVHSQANKQKLCFSFFWIVYFHFTWYRDLWWICFF